MTSCAVADTQSNESFHSLKAKMAPKNIAWKTSWRLMMYLAVLPGNLGDQLSLFLDFHFDLHLSPQNSKMLSNIEKSLKKKRFVSESIITRYNRNKHRKEREKAIKMILKAIHMLVMMKKLRQNQLRKQKKQNKNQLKRQKLNFHVLLVQE